MDKKKILVTGASGQLGQALQDVQDRYPNFDFVFADRVTLDITDGQLLLQYLDVHHPDVIINTAAYTAVDRAEQDTEAAFLVNEKGVEHIALACKSRNIQLLHISTDYVFDGKSSISYLETDVVNPQTVYGCSKLAGEKKIQAIAPGQYYIVRTSWLFYQKGHNFYNTMLHLAASGKEISVVDDQWGCPTRADDLAAALLYLIQSERNAPSGVYHYAGEGECTWYAFAKAILEKHRPNNYKLKPVKSFEYPTAAKRPRYSVLNTSLIKKRFGINIRSWKSMF